MILSTETTHSSTTFPTINSLNKKIKEEYLKERKQQREMRKYLPPKFCGILLEDAVMSDIPFDFISHQETSEVELWLIQGPKIDYMLADLPKAETNPHQYHALFKEVFNTHRSYTHIYTDCSKRTERLDLLLHGFMEH